MIIGISGKKQSGKDTVGQIIQYLIASNKDRKNADSKILSYEFQGLTKNNWDSIYNIIDWRIKKFADKLKQITCLLINCTMEDLENEEFKNKELGEEWTKNIFAGQTILEEYEKESGQYIYYGSALGKDGSLVIGSKDCYLSYNETLTPRLLLQLIGTECGRRIIHPNIWVNSLMSEYKNRTRYNSIRGEIPGEEIVYPNWIVTDVRFPNEAEAIKNRGGILIRINRPQEFKPNPGDTIRLYGIFSPFVRVTFTHKTEKGYNGVGTDGFKYVSSKASFDVDEHESETALDNYDDFDYIVENNSSIEELINKINNILKNEKLVKEN